MKKTKRVLSAVMAGILAFSTMGAGPVFAAPEESQLFALSLGEDYLTAGTPSRLYLEGKEDLAIKSVTYEAPDEKVTIDPKTGAVSIKEGYTPVDRETIEVKATVTYYDPADVVFHDGFEGEKKFTETEARSKSYEHSTAEAHWGRSAGTPVAGEVGPVKHTISSGKDQLGTVTAWFYDTGDTTPSQAKLAFEVNQDGVAGNHATGVVYDGTVGSNENYGKRSGNPKVSYGWDDTEVKRTKGWHQFRWEVTADGTKAYIDDAQIYDSKLLTSIGWIQLMTNWNGNQDNIKSICNKMFFDDVTVVKPGADENLKTEVVTAAVTLRELIEYDLVGKTEVFFNQSAPEAKEIQMTPKVDPDMKIMLGETVLTEGNEYTVEGDRVIFSKEYLSSLTTGKYEFQFVLLNKTVAFTVVVIDSTAGTDYYFSNNGNDESGKGTEASPYASLEKLNSLDLQPGDTVYLDAKSIWNGQIMIDDSGLPGMPITITKYNADSRDDRPVVNAGQAVTKDNITKPKILTLANQGTDCYAAGALEIRNASYVNVSGLELTNDGGESDKERINGRNGILVIADLPAETTAATYNAEWEKSAQTSIYIDDCYVHDVNSSPSYKMAGGINFFGNIDDILVENCTTKNCDNEGIRNAGLYNRNNSWPATLKVVFRNNYIDGSTGDGMVISNVLNSTISGNVVTNCGKPELSGAANYAALWLIGAENTIVENNEVFSNPYSCNDGEAFDFDHQCKGSVYQYNYTHDNAGGVLLTMGSVADRNIFRYNISVDDGGYYNKHLFFGDVSGRKGTYYYNNVFMVAPLVEKLFEANVEVNFYNNILMALHGNVPAFSGGAVTGGMIKNNIIYPQSLLNGSFGTAEVADNLFVNPLLGGPGSKPEGLVMADAATDNAHLDLSKLEAYKLLENSPAINAGAEVELPAVFAAVGEAEKDFFGNPINGKPDIGVHEWSNDSPELTVPEVLPESIEIKADKTEIDPKESLVLQAVVTPADAWESTVRWSSSDPEIVKVDGETGVVTGVYMGTATVRATSVADPTVFGEVEITVNDLGEGVLAGFKVQTESSSVKAGESVQLSVIGVDSKGNKVDLAPENLVVEYQTSVGTVDENGKLTIPEEASGTVSVSAKVTVLSQPDFAESFEAETTAFVGGTHSLVRTKERAQDGEWSMKTMNYGSDDDAIKTFLEPRQGTVSVWFYDAAGKTARKAVSVSPDKTLYALGVFKDTKTATYAYRIDGTNTWRDSKVKRTDGWHEFKWVFSDEGLKVYIDDTYVAENANLTNYTNISLLSRGGWTESDHNNNFGFDNIRTWIDVKYEAEDLGLTIIPKEVKYYTTSIKVDQKPDKQVYLVGEEFEPAGMKVSALQKAGTSDAERTVELDPESLAYEYDFSEAGRKTVTITYKELNAAQEEITFTAEVEVIVTEEPVEEDSYYTTGIRVDRNPDKREYLVDEAFEPEGMKVSALQKASPSDAERTVELDPEDLEYEYDFSEAGMKTVTIVYQGLNAEQEEETFTAEVKVSVAEAPTEEDLYYTTSIRVNRNPDKQVYLVDEEFDPEGMEVSALEKASPSNAVRTVEVDLEDLEYEYDFSKPGMKTVTVKYRGLDADQEEKTFTAKVKVSVTEEPVEEDSYYTTGIRVDRKPDKLVYRVNEEFDPEGMKVLALEKASPSNAVRTVDLNPEELEYEYDFTSKGEKKVKIVYYGLDKNQNEKKFTANLTVTVKGSSSSSSGSESSSSASGAWKQDANGWYFTYTAGGYAADKWERVGNTWYYFDQEGYMVTEWLYINNNWYYMDPLSGAMATGWHLDSHDEYWYYLDPVTGAIKTGWQQIGDNWYYLNPVVPEASWKFDETSKKWVYEDKNLVPYGAMYRNTTTPDGYQVDINGAWIK